MAQDTNNLEELQAKCEEYLSGWKRALADYENLQKQNSAIREEDRRRIRATLAGELLPVIDNFGHALRFIPDAADCPEDFRKRFEVWLQGIVYIDKQFMQALAEIGVEAVEAVGKPFDPHLHESGGSRWEEGKVEHEVVEELVRGYRIGDVVLRPAKVIVNQK